MNVTVLVPSALQGAVEGRAQLMLGFPPSAGVADVLEALFRLYPRLARHVLNEREPGQAGISLFLGERAALELAQRRPGLQEGDRLYLFAVLPRRQAGVKG